MSGKKKLWIDTDCGIDDSLAILICLNCQEYEIVGISCVGGNATLEQVIHNVNRTLNVWGHGSEKIPIYAGCSRAIIEEPMTIPDIHGKDGLGDINDSDFGINVPDRLEKENAINAIIDACEKYEDLYMLTLAPLTNIALALRMNIKAMSKVKHMYIMGGAEDGHGNTSPYAEFNFRADPHAAKIVLTTFPPEKTTMVSWTLTDHHRFEGEAVYNICGRTDTVMRKFEHDTWEHYFVFSKGIFWVADPLTAFVAIYGSVKSERLKINVLTEGEKIAMTEATPDPNGVNVPKEIDVKKFLQCIDTILSDH